MSKPWQIKDLTGQKFGRLTVLKFSRIEKHKTLWLCECECGNIVEANGDTMKRGKKRSCGCLYKDNQRLRKHGDYKTDLYKRWCWMRERVNPNSTNPGSHCYREKGIRVCDEWQSFETFRDWALTNGFSKELQLDRIDNDGDYCPENCRWVTPKENYNNKDDTLKITINGETKPLTVWCEQYGLPRHVVYGRIYLRGWEPLKALTTPKGNYVKSGKFTKKVG